MKEGHQVTRDRDGGARLGLVRLVERGSVICARGGILLIGEGLIFGTRGEEG